MGSGSGRVGDTACRASGRAVHSDSNTHHRSEL